MKRIRFAYHYLRVLLSGGLLLAVVGCASWKQVARTIDHVAQDLCAIHFGEQMGVSFEDAARLYCQTREALDPFVDAALAAQQEAGPIASQRLGVSAPKGD